MDCLSGTQSWLVSQCSTEVLERVKPCDYMKIKVLPPAATRSTMCESNHMLISLWNQLSGWRTLQSDGYYVVLFSRQVISKPQLRSLKWKYISGSVWHNAAWRTGERGAHSPLCPGPFDAITMWTSRGRITAYIYHRSCLIRLALLYPIGLRRKALLAHSLYNLIIHWCNLNKPKPFKSKEWTIWQESMRKGFTNYQHFFFLF